MFSYSLLTFKPAHIRALISRVTLGLSNTLKEAVAPFNENRQNTGFAGRVLVLYVIVIPCLAKARITVVLQTKGREKKERI
jgi:hypothetical protein